LTHVDAANRPTMVDVGAKTATSREASAEAIVKLPASVARELARTGHRTKKGPVFDTAIVAGVMAAKKTHEIDAVLPSAALERCTSTSRRRGGTMRIVCSVAVHHKTGVEMEALIGASAAALTIYDMCKALSHDIEIGPVRLLRKTRRQARLSRARAPAKNDDMPARSMAWCSPAAAARACSATRRPSNTAPAKRSSIAR
jgi:cyclic pyranopterin phosphate synthase